MPNNACISNHYVTGYAFRLDKIRTLRRAWAISRASYPSFREAWRAFFGMVRAAAENTRIRHITKGISVEGRVYTLMGMPGRPSPATELVIKNELHRCRPIPGYTGGLMVLLFAITKKCPLRCAHCFEWGTLNGKDTLSLDDLLTIVRKFQARGVAQIELSGGEPLHRLDDVLEVLRRSDTQRTDFWLLTSGYRFNAEMARQLKDAGLRGVSVSLDHWNAAEHDRFRGKKGSWDWAVQAARLARSAGLLVSLSLVPGRAFCNPADLWRYAGLARDLGVHFIRILEPRAVGRYAGLPVELDEGALELLENFVRQIQRSRDYPLVEYHATYQRLAGCGGAGRRYLYVDADGDLHACPFCRKKCGNLLSGPIDAGLQTLKRAGGCPAFHQPADFSSAGSSHYSEYRE